MAKIDQKVDSEGVNNVVARNLNNNYEPVVKTEKVSGDSSTNKSSTPFRGPK